MNRNRPLVFRSLDSKRDWGHARDYVRAMWLMLQQDEPGDYVIATGEQHSVREFVERAFAEVGIELAFEGEGLEEVGVVGDVDAGLLESARNGGWATTAGAEEPVTRRRVLVRVDHRYYRPTEVVSLLGDATKAREFLGWSPSVSFADLVHEMVWADLVDAQKYDCILGEWPAGD